jgi:hypothetical protein
MEACGIHDVWDITNILFANILVTAALECSERGIHPDIASKNVEQRLQQIGAIGLQLHRPDYSSFSKQLQASTASSHPPHLALNLLTQQIASALADGQDWIDLLRCFLTGSRSVYESYGTRLFQNILLGSAEFEKTYELPSNYEGAMLMQSEDKALLSPESVRRLRALAERDDFRIGIYTARPSRSPKYSGDAGSGYSPEAEIALEIVGLQDLPLIAMGMIDWLAKQHAERSEDLTKPNLTHALASMICALAGGNDVLALEEAYQIDKCHKNPDRTTLGKFKGSHLFLYVFEDTTSGIKPVLTLANVLNGHGYKLTVVPVGVATDTNKSKALQPLCSLVCGNINEGLERVSHFPSMARNN